MKLSKRWNKILSAAIAVVLITSLLITYPAFNVTRAGNTSTISSTAELSWNATLGNIYVDTANVSYIAPHTLVTEYNAENDVYYWNGTDFVEVSNKGIFFVVEADQNGVNVNVSSTNSILLSLDGNDYTNAIEFPLNKGDLQEIYVDVSGVKTPSFGVITFVFTNASGYHESYNYFVYVTKALTSGDIKVLPDNYISKAEIEDLNITWTNMATDGVDEYNVYVEVGGKMYSYTTENNYTAYKDFVTNNIPITNAKYKIWVIPHWGGHWDVPGIGANVTSMVKVTFAPIPGTSQCPPQCGRTLGCPRNRSKCDLHHRHTTPNCCTHT